MTGGSVLLLTTPPGLPMPKSRALGPRLIVTRSVF
jgi:hypothetical protein